MPGEEQRKEQRYPAQLLPESLQTVQVIFASRWEAANLIDASRSGFGFQIKKPAKDFVVGASLILYPLGTDQPLYGKIAYAKAVDDETTRVGIYLKDVGSYEAYRNELEQIIALLEE